MCLRAFSPIRGPSSVLLPKNKRKLIIKWFCILIHTHTHIYIFLMKPHTYIYDACKLNQCLFPSQIVCENVSSRWCLLLMRESYNLIFCIFWNKKVTLIFNWVWILYGYTYKYLNESKSLVRLQNIFFSTRFTEFYILTNTHTCMHHVYNTLSWSPDFSLSLRLIQTIV